jgi:quaternary ammonium compound-resistance protein SugE
LFLNLSIAVIPLGTAYAIWTGIGAAGTAVIGMIAFQEPATRARIVLISALVLAVVGLKFVSAG